MSIHNPKTPAEQAVAAAGYTSADQLARDLGWSAAKVRSALRNGGFKTYRTVRTLARKLNCDGSVFVKTRAAGKSTGRERSHTREAS
jgi:hypothetical protein